MENRSLAKLIKFLAKQSPVQIYTPILRKSFTKHGLFSSISPQLSIPFQQLNPVFIASRSLSFSKPSIRLVNFSTSADIRFWNKLVPDECATQFVMKPLVVQGVGWAGQPIVKRVHPILPEVEGDVCDIIIPAEEPALDANINTTDVDINIDDTNVNNIEETKTDLQSQPQIFLGRNEVKTIIEIKVDPPLESLTQATGITNHVRIDDTVFAIHEHTNDLHKPDIIIKSPKKKSKKKKKTVVLNPYTKLTMDSNNIQTNKKKRSKLKGFSTKKKNKLQKPHVLNQNINTSAGASRHQTVLLVDNRQLQTYSALHYPKKSRIEGKKERKSDRKGKGAGKKSSTKEQIADDCECPETFVHKGRKQGTEMCGSASGVEEDKKDLKKWKPKMCLAEGKRKIKRGRTKVCKNLFVSKKHEKENRKKELPKCPKPVKKEVPKVIVCPPNLFDEEEEETKKKECVKVEEVKVRKRTKVCRPKPRIFDQEEEKSQIKSEKLVCVAKAKKILSRHTKVCLPPDEKINKPKQKSKH